MTIGHAKANAGLSEFLYQEKSFQKKQIAEQGTSSGQNSSPDTNCRALISGLLSARISSTALRQH